MQGLRNKHSGKTSRKVYSMASFAPYPSAPLILALSPEEEVACFNDLAMYFLGISGEEFLKRYKLGEYAPLDKHPGAIELVQRIPRALASQQ